MHEGRGKGTASFGLGISELAMFFFPSLNCVIVNFGFCTLIATFYLNFICVKNDFMDIE